MSFANFAYKYFESGFSVIPLDGKRPIQNAWQKYCEVLPNEDEINTWSKQYPENNIGLCCGQASNLVAFDFDFEGENASSLSNAILQILPPTPLVKIGAKGWTRFYRFSQFNRRNIKYKKTNIADILTTGKQTVIPPSVHPISGQKYYWVDEDLINFNVSELNQLNDEMFDKIEIITKDFFEDKSTREDETGRNNYLKAFGFVMIEQSKSVEDLAQKLFEQDQKKFGVNSYFCDVKENKRKDPSQFAWEMADRIYKKLRELKKSKGIDWDFGLIDSTEQVDDLMYQQYKKIFNTALPNVKRCKLAGDLICKKDGEEIYVENQEKILKAECMVRGFRKGDVPEYMARWLNEIKPTYLFDLPKWDGVDHISEMLNFVKVTNIEQKYFTELMKEWLAGIFRRLDDNEFQNRMVILEGGQGIGKDTFITAMLRDLNPYFANAAVQEKETENFNIMTRKAVINISEFDRTSRLQVSQIKAMITAPDATFRTPYDRAPKTYKFRTSFISSCNLSDVLRDETGNRRYLFFNVDSIDWGYPMNLSGQVLAQARELAEKQYKASVEAERSMKAILDRLTPDRWEEGADELWNERFPREFNLGSKKNYIGFGDAQRLCNEISKDIGVSGRMVLSFIKRKYQKRLNIKRYYTHAGSLNENLTDVTDIAVTREKAVTRYPIESTKE